MYKKNIVFVGSGPISLIKACLLAEKESETNIKIITSDSKLGGAWYTETSPMGFEIESGCHIWSYHPEAYEFLGSYLKLKLDEKVLKPYFVLNNKRIKYSWVKNLEGYYSAFKNIAKGKFSNVKAINEKYYLNKMFTSKKTQYPKKGSPEFLNKLISKVKSLSNIEVKINTHIHSLTFLDNKVVVKNSTKEFIADKVFITSVTQVDKILHFKKKSIIIKPTALNYIHFLFSSDEKLPVNLNYCRFLKDEHIHRYANLSSQTDHKENLFIVGVFQKSFEEYETEFIQEYILSKLERNNILQGHNIEFIKVFEYETNYISEKHNDEINKLDDRLELMHSTDLMNGIKKIVKAEDYRIRAV